MRKYKVHRRCTVLTAVVGELRPKRQVHLVRQGGKRRVFVTEGTVCIYKQPMAQPGGSIPCGYGDR